MATNVIHILNDELCKLEARRAEVEGQLRTIERSKQKPDDSANKTNSDESTSGTDLQADVLLAGYNDLKKRHFHLQNDHAALSSTNQDLKIENSILTKKCDYLSIELARLANINLSAELIRLSRFANDNCADIATGGHADDSAFTVDNRPLLLNDHESAEKNPSAEAVQEVSSPIVLAKRRGRPRKNGPHATVAPKSVHTGAPAPGKKRGRKPGFRLGVSATSAGCSADSGCLTVATPRKRGRRGNITNLKRKQQYDELKKEEVERKRACTEARQKRRDEKWAREEAEREKK